METERDKEEEGEGGTQPGRVREETASTKKRKMALLTSQMSLFPVWLLL